MKLVKRLGIVLGVIVVLLIVGVVILLVSIDAVAKTGIEKGATYALGVPTTLKSADIRVFSGKFALNGLDVANPEGFDKDHFLALGNGKVDVSYATLRKPTIELPLFQLDDVSLNLEKSSKGSNYGIILDNLKKFDSGEKPKENAPKSEKKLVIKKININDIEVHVEFLPIGGMLTERDIRIDHIELTDVGKDGGVKTSELIGIIMQAILASGGDLIPADMLGDLNAGLEGLTDLGEMGIGVATEGVEQIGAVAGQAAEAAGEAADAAGEALEDAADQVGGALDDAAKGIGGLLGGGDDDKKDDKKKDPP